MNSKTACSATSALRAEISEIFSSLQGEGPYLGVRQIFVRFGRCNMHCAYCDELEKMQAGRFRLMTAHEILRETARLVAEKGEHHSISLTGGDPLFYPEFLAEFLPALKAAGWRTYLETNGTLLESLAPLIRFCDIIAMDLKPPSSTSDRSFWAEQEAFLRLALRAEVFVKLVVTATTSAEDIRRSVNLVADVSPVIPFIFQPVSDALGINSRALEKIESEFFALASTRLHDVRVIPQMHKIWGVR